MAAARITGEQDEALERLQRLEVESDRRADAGQALISAHGFACELDVTDQIAIAQSGCFLMAAPAVGGGTDLCRRDRGGVADPLSGIARDLAECVRDPHRRPLVILVVRSMALSGYGRTDPGVNETPQFCCVT